MNRTDNRGFAAIGLDQPKCNANVGAVLRAAQCFGAAMVVASGQRYHRAATDTSKAFRHMPLLHDVEDVMACIPFDCVPVAVELVPNAKSLFDYKHPARAYYIFGAEDATLGKRVLDRCRDIVYIPMVIGCLNLSMCVNIVLYDRAMKGRNHG